MKTIWKFPLQITDEQEIMVKGEFQPLAVQMQGDQPCLWALVDPETENVMQKIFIYGTGHPVPDNPMAYIDTFQCMGGGLVFHVFKPEKIKQPIKTYTSQAESQDGG